MGHWIVRAGVIAVGSWYVVRAAIVVIIVFREGERVDFRDALGLLLSGAVGALLAASGATGNLTLAWAALAVFAFDLGVRGLERLLGPPEPG